MTGERIGAAHAVMPGAKYLTNVCLVGKVDGKVRRYGYRCSDGQWVFVQRYQVPPNHADECIPAELTFSR